MKATVHIFWFRRDLRLSDNAGLYHLLKQSIPVVPIFIFDTYILEDLQDQKDRRVAFIYEAVKKLHQSLAEMGSSIEVYYGKPEEIFLQLADKYTINSVAANHDYEPYAIERDSKIKLLLQGLNIPFETFKDQVIFEKKEIVKDTGEPYTVFTPYSKKWLSTLSADAYHSFETESYFSNFFQQPPFPLPTLDSMGFHPEPLTFPASAVEKDLLKQYATDRNFPGVDGTSRLGVHLRFGTISIRKLVAQSMEHSKMFLNELIWREFYQMILWNFPQVGQGRAFKPAYDRIPWRNDEEEFKKWTEGLTGYPIVDAGIRQLKATGFMHNRVRMVVASFLTKHLLIDWRWGEAHFAQHLLDFDLASNNGGWQWVSGSGCDSAPYFRIFNPYLQTEKFDPELKYTSKWAPDFQEFSYPAPMVDHEFARKRCIEVYSKALAENR